MNLAKEEEHVRGLILFVSKKNEIAMEAYSKFGFMAPELKLMFFDNGRV